MRRGRQRASGGTGGGETGGGGRPSRSSPTCRCRARRQGRPRTMVNAIKLYLEQIGGKAGDFTVSYESFDDSTAAKGSLGRGQCSANARKYVEDEAILWRDRNVQLGLCQARGPDRERGLARVREPRGNTAVGLTHEGPGSEPGGAGQVLPERRAQLHARGRIGRLPGTDRRHVHGRTSWASPVSTSWTTRTPTGRASRTRSRSRPRTSASRLPAIPAGTRTRRTTRP